MTGSQSYGRRARARDKVAEAAYDLRADTSRGVRAADEKEPVMSEPMAGLRRADRAGWPCASRERRCLRGRGLGARLMTIRLSVLARHSPVRPNRQTARLTASTVHSTGVW